MALCSNRAMKPTHLFTDLGGVILTNGWDHTLRSKVAKEFGIDQKEMEDRHHLTYDTYESGKCDLITYLDRIIFYQPRDYSQQQVVDFILSQAKANTETIELVKELKAKHGLKVAAISNEGRELGEDRVQRFQLTEFLDFIVISGCVGLRKPDLDIWRLALDLAQVKPEQVVYLDDRKMLADVAGTMGFRAVWHRDAVTTRATLAEMGLD